VISGALEIICGVEAALVHPLLLPASQGPEKFGYIVIAYDDSPDVFDILFVHGDRVAEYAGLHHELRTLLTEDSVRRGLAACAMRCRVYLFSVSRQGFDRFLMTFHCVPSVNVVIDRLSRKQLSSLLTGIGCTNGILEIDRPAFPFPLMDLNRFHSVEELLKEAFRFRQGRMIVYDLELNSMIHQRLESAAGGTPSLRGEARVAGGEEKTEPDTMAEGEEAPDRAAHSEGATPDDSGAEGFAAPFRNALQDFRHVLTQVFHSTAPFDPGMINASNATHVLTVIEECVKRGWLDNRKTLKTKAREIVKDLYDTNFLLLRKHGVEGKVQECYRRLGE